MRLPWDNARQSYDLFLSDETLRELQEPGYPQEKRDKCLALVKDVSRLAVTREVTELVAYYVAERLMPADDLGDAFHLAFATWYRIQYLLTWNCKHLANANKFEHIEVLLRTAHPMQRAATRGSGTFFQSLQAQDAARHGKRFLTPWTLHW